MIGTMEPMPEDWERAVCVVDREEGGSEALAAAGVRLRALFLASEVATAASAAEAAV